MLLGKIQTWSIAQSRTGTLPKSQWARAAAAPWGLLDKWLAVEDVEALPTRPRFLGQALRAMRCKANGWTLHSRMEMEELLFCRPLGRTKLCRWKLLATNMKRSPSGTPQQQRHAGVWITAGWWETGDNWHSWGEGAAQIKEKSGSSSFLSRHASTLFTGLENSSLFRGLWFTPRQKLTIII